MYLGDDYLDRVKSAYRRAIASEAEKSGIWLGIEDLQRPVHEALLSDSNEPLRKIFADPMTTDLFYGVDNLSKTILGDRYTDKDVVFGLGSEVRRHISYLAKEIGTADDPEVVLSAFDRILGQRIDFPAPFLRGEIGVGTSRGIASYRAIQALYQAYRTVELVGGSKSVVEIGPGMGRGVYYCYRAGMTDYTTIDIPLGIVRQACFLGAALGPDRIWFEGENAASQAGRIRLLNSGSFPTRKFAVAVNVDSLTEIPRSPAASYMRWMNRRVGVFFSINHEKNSFTVTDLASSDLDFKKHTKRDYPVRSEYFEEVFLIDSSLSSRIRRYFSERAASARRFRPVARARLSIRSHLSRRS